MDTNQLDVARRKTSWPPPVTRVMIGAFFRAPTFFSHLAPVDWSDHCRVGLRLLSKWFATSAGPKSDPFSKALAEFFFGHAETQFLLSAVWQGEILALALSAETKKIHCIAAIPGAENVRGTCAVTAPPSQGMVGTSPVKNPCGNRGDNDQAR